MGGRIEQIGKEEALRKAKIRRKAQPSRVITFLDGLNHVTSGTSEAMISPEELSPSGLTTKSVQPLNEECLKADDMAICEEVADLVEDANKLVKLDKLKLSDEDIKSVKAVISKLTRYIA